MYNATNSRVFAGLLIALAACSRADTPAPDARAKASDQVIIDLRYDRSLLLETTSETSANVSIGDVDGDGKLDLVLAKGRHWPLVDRVQLGDGRGGIRAAYDLGSASDRSYSGQLADLDNDGDLDVVISNDTPDPKLVYLNDGKGRFTASPFGRAEWATRNARIADMNGDHLPDIVVANRAGTNSTNYICINRGAGRFDSNCSAFSHEPSTTVTPVDIDRDGRMDIVVPHRDGGQSYVYRFGGSSDFTDAERIPFGPADAGFRMAEVADFNGDSLLDIVAIDERSGAWLHFGQPDRRFAAGVRINDRPSAPYALTLSDLNRDGRMDIIVGHIEAPSIAYLNDGTGRGFTRLPFGDNKGAVYGFAVGDIDADGVLDIAVARSDAPNLLFFGSRALTQR
ncbi:MAG: VCBS repeat-containing protein [Gemmatimonadota bacterium]